MAGKRGRLGEDINTGDSCWIQRGVMGPLQPTVMKDTIERRGEERMAEERRDDNRKGYCVSNPCLRGVG